MTVHLENKSDPPEKVDLLFLIVFQNALYKSIKVWYTGDVYGTMGFVNNN
jgi:hypothetical protein